MYVIKKKNVIFLTIIILVIVAVSLSSIFINASANRPIYGYTIVIDAGHGGIDSGVLGYSGKTLESDLNLEYALCLEQYFKSLNINVVQTRTTKDGLYSSFSTNKKLDDMKKRAEIINSANADIVISIHQNGYILPNQRGICAFFNPEISTSQDLAKSMQEVFQENIEYARREALAGDYFILNCTNRTSVLVECGFLTSPEDEALLIQDSYKQKICYNIFSGVIKYLIQNSKLQIFDSPSTDINM